MNQRENYRAYMHGDPAARCPNIDMGPLMPTYERWQSEGLSPELDPRRYDQWCDAFGLDRFPLRVSVNPPREPLYEEVVLEETDTTHTIRRSDGSIIHDNKGSLKSIPHVIRPAVTTRAEWDRLKEWLDVDSPLPDETAPRVAETLRQARQATHPVKVGVGYMMGAPRNWLGFERAATLLYDDPKWYEDIVETCCRGAERQVRFFGEHDVPLEGIAFSEDICYKNGPMFSPEHMRRYGTPRYRRVADLGKKYGYDLVSLDSDGNLSAFVEPWIEGGINILLPLEVQAGMDVNELQRQYEGRMTWWGGIHKSRLAGSEQDIVDELERIKPAVERGGYVPTADHNLPPEIPFENFKLYLRLRGEILELQQTGL